MIKIILTCIFGAILLGCAAKGPEVAPCFPPVVYLQDVPEPALRGQTNQEMLLYMLDLKDALYLANSDKKALRKWADSLQK
jgi:hypothetical protein